MLASQIKVTALKSWVECQDAIDAIESNYRNVVGGLNAWYSGRNTELTTAAKTKIAAIEKKQAGFDCDDE